MISCDNIPESELMAEKLGIITLCRNCGERIELVPDYLNELLKDILKADGLTQHFYTNEKLWMHSRGNAMRCFAKKKWPIAIPRNL